MGSTAHRGSLLLLAGILTMIIAGIVTSLLLIASSGAKRETMQDCKCNAREIAETALHLSLNNLRQATDGVDNDDDGEVDEAIDYHSCLLDCAVVPALEGQLGRIGTVFWTLGSDINGNGYPNFGEPHVSPVPFAGGEMIAYTVFSQGDGLDNDWDGKVDEGDEAGFVTVVALGCFQGIIAQARFTGSFVDVFAPPNSPGWNPNGALLCGGNLSITGNASITGTCADVHANQFLAVTGNCDLGGNATASGGCSVSGGAGVMGFTRGDLPPASIPHIHPPSLLEQADFVLARDGRIYDASGTVIHDALAQGSFNGWAVHEGGWHFNGNGVNPDNAQGTYYVEGDAKIAGTGQGATIGKSGGGETQLFRMTVIATGNLQMAGNTRIQHAHPDGLLFIAGGDIRLTGTPQLDQVLEGLIAAHEQVFIAGTPEIAGAIVAQDAANRANLNLENKVPGTPNITYDGGINTELPALDPCNPWFILNPKILGYEER